MSVPSSKFQLPATIWQFLKMQGPVSLVAETEGNLKALFPVSHWPVLLLILLERLLHLSSNIPLAPIFMAGLHSIQQTTPESYDSLTFCLAFCLGQLGSMSQREQETSDEARKTEAVQAKKSTHSYCMAVLRSTQGIVTRLQTKLTLTLK